MERKVYKTVILIIFFGMVSMQNFAQQTTSSSKTTDTTTQKDYQQEMKNLQQNMRDLQKQMMDLRQQHMQETLKKNAETLKGLNGHNFNYIQGFGFAVPDSLSNKIKALVNTNIAGLDNLYSYNFSPNSLTYSNGNSNSNKQQEKLIEKIKTFSKSYSINKNDKLTIDNQYGKVTVNTWNKNEFKVDVEIKIGTTDETETQKLLDGVDIVSTQDQSGISFKTKIEDPKSNTNGFFGIRVAKVNGRTIHSLSVNYTVFMPVKNALDITNRYGAVILPNLEGAVTIHNTYGSFTAKELSNVANNINLRYIDANIGELNGGDLNLQYGKLKIGTANNLNAIAGYSPVNIDRLKSSAKIRLNYGSGLQIDNLDKNLKNLDINARFANVSLNLNGSENFLFDVTVNHNVFDYNNSTVKLLDQPSSEDAKSFNPTKIYKGYVGKSGSDNKVTIKSNYQRVSFN